MCTLHFFDCSNKAKHIEAIKQEWQYNRDGFSVVCLKYNSTMLTASCRMQCLALEDTVRFLECYDADYYMCHLRASTMHHRDDAPLTGCHMFTSECGDWIYAHNGVIHGKIVDGLHVDSLVIGKYDLAYRSPAYVLSSASLPYTFANVLAFHIPTGCVLGHRSQGGTLHRNGECVATKCVSVKYKPAKCGWFNIVGSIDDDGFLDTSWV